MLNGSLKHERRASRISCSAPGRLKTGSERLCGTRVGPGAMLGIHPLWLDSTTPAELVGLRELAESLLDDPHFIGLGEVGLDGFEPGLDQHKAEQVFLEELKIARDLDLPLSIHVRRTASKTLGLLRRVYGSPGKTGFSPCAAPSMPLTARMLNARLFSVRTGARFRRCLYLRRKQTHSQAFVGACRRSLGA